MTITISEKDASVIYQILALLQRKKIPFKIENRSSEPSLNDENIVWDWEDVDEIAFANFALSQIADDWECPDEWLELLKQTA